MKFLLPFLFFLMSCAHQNPNSNYRIPQAEKAIEYIEFVTGPSPLIVNIPTLLQFKIQNNNNVRRIVRLKSGAQLKLNKEMVTTKSDGTFDIEVTLLASEKTNLNLSVDRLNKSSLSLELNFDFLAKAPVTHFVSQIDRQFSKVSWSKNNLIANKTDQSVLKLELKNKTSEDLHALPKLKIEVKDLDKLKLISTSQDKNILSLTFETLDSWGGENLNISLSDAASSLSWSISQVIKPSINYQKVLVINSEQTASQFTLALSLQDIFGKQVDASHAQIFKAILNGKELKVESHENHFIVKGNFPSGEGSVAIQYIIDGNNVTTTQSLTYKNQDLDLSKFKFEMAKNSVTPFSVILQNDKFFEANYLQIDAFFQDSDLPILEEKDLKDLKVEFSEGSLGKIGPYVNRDNKLLLRIFPAQTSPEVTGLKISYKDTLLKELTFKSNFLPKSDKLQQRTTTFPFSMSDPKTDELTLDVDDYNKDSVNDGVVQRISWQYYYPHPNLPHACACDADPDSESSSPCTSEREFDFSFKDHARQDIHLFLRDNTSDFDSRNVQSTFYFFPRKVIPHYETSEKMINFILPTGEKVPYNRENKSYDSPLIHDGEASYGSMNPKNCTNHNRQYKNFPQFSYKGTGVVIRFNASSGAYLPQDPGSDKGAVITGEAGHIGQKGALAYYFDQTTEKYVTCLIPTKAELIQTGSILFKFSKDEEVADYLHQKCGKKFKERILNPSL